MNQRRSGDNRELLNHRSQQVSDFEPEKRPEGMHSFGQRTPALENLSGAPAAFYVDHSHDRMTEEGLRLMFRLGVGACSELVEDSQKDNAAGGLEGLKRFQSPPSDDSRKLAFPQLLYQMLHEASEKGLDHIVSWQKHGRAFIIHDREEFVKRFMPRYAFPLSPRLMNILRYFSFVLIRYFNSSRFASFARQLSWYMFSRVDRGPDKGALYHKLFLRGRPDLMVCITRRSPPKPSLKLRRVKGALCMSRADPRFEDFPVSKELSKEALSRLVEASTTSPRELLLPRQVIDFSSPEGMVIQTHQAEEGRMTRHQSRQQEDIGQPFRVFSFDGQTVGSVAHFDTTANVFRLFI